MTRQPTITPEIEAQMLAAMSPDVCLTMPQSSYRVDGALMIHRENRSIRAQRYLWSLVFEPIPRGLYLSGPFCHTAGCVNPHHFRLSTRSAPLPTHCPNGHEYTPENTLPEGRDRCRTCREARLARRRLPFPDPNPAEVNRAKTVCPYGHTYTPANIYWSTDSDGHKHRRCRTCGITQARARRAKAQREKEAA